jgi:ribosomal protein L27
MSLAGVNFRQIVSNSLSVFGISVRFASKKAGSSTRNTSTKVRPKHRGWKVQDGHQVEAGTILATQRTLRFHPGLNVQLSTALRTDHDLFLL